MKFRVLILLLIALLIAGCAEEQKPILTTTPTPTPMPTPKASPTPHVTSLLTPTPTPTPVTSPTITPSPTPFQPSPTPTPLLFGVKYKVKVVDVIDGDTIDVIMPDGVKERIRMLGVDTPETTASKNKPYEYDDITDLECLEYWGIQAKNFAKTSLKVSMLTSSLTLSLV